MDLSERLEYGMTGIVCGDCGDEVISDGTLAACSCYALDVLDLQSGEVLEPFAWDKTYEPKNKLEN